MTSPFSTLFLAIQQRITTQVSSIRWVDQDLGQLEAYGDRPPVSWPCVLIDFDNFSYEDLGENIQLAEGQVSIRLAFTPFSPTNNLAPTAYKEKALAYYDMEWALYKALHGWKPEDYGYLMRTGVITEAREDTIRVRRMTFSITFEDYNAQPVLETMPAPEPEVLGDLELPD